MFVFSTPLLMLQYIYPSVEIAFDLTRAEVVAISSVKFATSAIVALTAGFLIDRLGVKRVLYTCATVTGLGMVYFRFIDSPLMYWLAGIPMGFSSLPLLLATKTLVTRWFNRRLGLALGLAAAASSVAGIVFPVFYAWLTETYGWNNALPIMSVAILVVVFPVVHFVVRDTPSAEELQSEFGADLAPRQLIKGRLIENAPDEPDKIVEAGSTLAEIARSPVFVVLCVVQLAVGFADQGFTQNATPFIVNDLGFSLRTAAITTSLSFMVGFTSKIFFGWLFDRISLPGISICYVMIAGYITLAFGIQGVMTLVIFQLARGFAHSGVLMEEPVLAKHAFGPFHLGKVLGTFSTVTAIGLTMGPITVAMLYERAGQSYYPAFGLLSGLMLASATAIFFISPTYRLQMLRERREMADAAG